MRERHDRHAHARHAADLRGEHAAGVDHDLGLDRAPLGLHAAHALRGPPGWSTSIAGDARVREDAAAARARAVGERGREQRRVEVAVARQVGGAAHAVGAHQREQLARLLARRSARAAGRTSWPTRPGAAPPARARACTRGGCRRTAPSRSRACDRARRSPSSCASASTLDRSWPTRPAEWKVEPLVSSLRSSSTTSRSPSLARWWAIDAPPTPPPMMTTRARSGSSRGRAIGSCARLDRRRPRRAIRCTCGWSAAARRRSKCSRA